MTKETRDETLARLMAAYGSALVRLCTLYLSDYAAAQDAVQDTFVKAYKHLEDLSDARAEKAWLTAIAVNTCKDHKRRAWQRLVVKTDCLEQLPHTQYEQKQQDDTVLSAIARLPEKYRQVILLRYYQGLSLEETAQAVGVPAHTVSSRLGRAKEKLRSALKGWYFDED